MHKNTDQSTLLFGLELFSSTKAQLLTEIDSRVKSQKLPIIIATPNPEQVMLSRRDSVFLDHLQSFDLRIPDGNGLVWASKLLANKNNQPKLTERITGVWLTKELLKKAERAKKQVLIVGGRHYKYYVSNYLRLSWTEGYENVQSPTEAEEKALEALLMELKPAYVFVAFGAPAQEAWIIAHRHLLEKTGVEVAMTVGGAFDMLFGITPRAPGWIRTLKLEWFYRLIQEPSRWRRQLQLIEFVKLTFKALLKIQ